MVNRLQKWWKDEWEVRFVMQGGKLDHEGCEFKYSDANLSTRRNHKLIETDIYNVFNEIERYKHMQNIYNTHPS